MKKTFALFFALLLLVPGGAFAQRFKYTYRGVEFSCRARDGRVSITGFDRDAAQVRLPAQVTDKNGRTYQVVAVDLGVVDCKYQTAVVAIEPGVTEIAEYCFYYFPKLERVYIPNTIEKIDKKAFRPKSNINFTMPGNIRREDLLAGRAVYPKVGATDEQVYDPTVGLDLADYMDDSQKQPGTAVRREEVQPKSQAIQPGTSDIDFNIPTGALHCDNTFCLIIANEEYSERDTPGVKYAVQDGKTFRDYCQRTLGIPTENIRFLPNASYLDMKGALTWFKDIADVYGTDSKFIFYYAGHGIPDEQGNCKLVPADVSINAIHNAYGLQEIYRDLGRLNTNQVLVLIDACFSGNDRGDVAATDEEHRGIVRNVKQGDVSGKVVVLTAASGTETALAYEEQAHGLFSYFLMKKLQETKGKVSFGELYDYLKTSVTRKSVVSKGKRQTPSVIVPGALTNQWKSLTF